MRKSVKHLLGLAGLALVGAMTAVACAMPAPEASAVGTTVPVKVSVGMDGTVPAVEIEQFTVGETDSVFKKRFNVTVSYINTTDLFVYLKQGGAVATQDIESTPSEGEISIDTSGCNVEFSHAWQSCELAYDLTTFDLADPSGTTFMTRAEVFNQEVGNRNDAQVDFTYRSAFLMEFGGEYMQNGDPSMEAILNEDVKSAYIIVYDKDGKQVEIPSNDGDGRYKLDLSQKVGDNLKFALPLWEANAPAGEYRVVLMAYDTEEPSEDGLIGVSTVSNVKYNVKNPDKPKPSDPSDPNVPGGPNNPNNPDRPTDPGTPGKPGDGSDTPDVPGTGLNLFSDLNISQADYIVTGLVAFGMVTIFAVFLMIRRSRR